MVFKMTSSDYFRVSFLGFAFVLTIPELALLAVFTRHSVSQGSIYLFEIMGFVTSSLTVVLLPMLIFCPRIAPNAVVSLLVSEILVLVILSGLWLGFVILEGNQQDKWYPVPKAYQNQKNVNVCQFVPEEEVHWCKQLDSNSVLTILIMASILLYTVLLVGFSLLFQIRGTPFWTRTSRDLLDQKTLPTRQPQQPQVSVPRTRSQPEVSKLPLFGSRWKKGKGDGILPETASAQDGSDYNSLLANGGDHPSTLPLNPLWTGHGSFFQYT